VLHEPYPPFHAELSLGGLGVILTILTRIDVTLKALATDSLKFVCMAWSKPSTLYGISNPTSTKIVG
jgi:hypothetical protein